MKYLLDDVVRVLATPMPRRKTFKLLGGLLAGGMLGGLGVRPAMALIKCGEGHCAQGLVCCGTGSKAACGDKCCSGVACDTDEHCCKTAPFCVDKDKQCPASNSPGD